MSSVIYVICKSRASHSDDYMCVVFAIVAGTSVLQSPCLTHGQGIWFSPMILSPLVAENLWVYYRCHRPVPSSRLAPSLGFKGTEQSYPPLKVPGWNLSTGDQRHHVPLWAPCTSALTPSHSCCHLASWTWPLLLPTLVPVLLRAVCTYTTPRAGTLPLTMRSLPQRPPTCPLPAAHGSCSHSSWLHLTRQHYCFSSSPLMREALYALPDRGFQEGFLTQSCGASKDKFSIPHPSLLQRSQAFWGHDGLYLGGLVRTLTPTQNQSLSPSCSFGQSWLLPSRGHFSPKVWFSFPIAFFFLKRPSPSNGSVISKAYCT